MKFVRFGEAGREKPGLVRDETGDETGGGNGGEGYIIDLSPLVLDLDGRFWGEGGVDLVARRLASGGLDSLRTVARDSVRLGPPVASPGKIVCVGQNYADHIRESGGSVPETPVLFGKAVTALGGPFDEIVIPRDEQTADWEVELAVVIGKRAKRVAAGRAMDFVAGFAVMNDVTERRPQKSEGQWHRAKSFDTYAPFGPWVATADEIDDPQSLELWLDVNGERMQEGSTKNMIFGVPELLEFITRGMTLLPGDIVSTGTPPGVGAFRDPPVFLRPGDVVELGITGLGSQRSRVVRESACRPG